MYNKSVSYYEAPTLNEEDNRPSRRSFLKGVGGAVANYGRAVNPLQPGGLKAYGGGLLTLDGAYTLGSKVHKKIATARRAKDNPDFRENEVEYYFSKPKDYFQHVENLRTLHQNRHIEPSEYKKLYDKTLNHAINYGKREPELSASERWELMSLSDFPEHQKHIVQENHTLRNISLNEKLTAATIEKRRNQMRKQKAIMNVKRKLATKIKPTREVALKRAKRSAREQIRKKRLGAGYKSKGLAMVQRANTFTGSERAQVAIKRLANKLLPTKMHKHII